MSRTNDNTSRRYTNVALTAIVALLGWQALDGADTGALLGPASPAIAAGGEQPRGGLISAADQRKLMIVEMNKMNNRLDRLESTLSKGINVKVVDMPKQAKDDE